MSYHSCRWYDPYPRLAFALKLLYLAPGSLQARASQELQTFLDTHWGSAHADRTAYEVASRSIHGKRWYDEATETAQTVELIKNSPDPLKSLMADTLLEILGADPA